MGIFKKRKNKTFSYEPRFYNDEGKGSPYKVTQKFDEFRAPSGGGIKGKFKHAIADLRNNPDRKVNRRVLYIVVILLFIFLYLIDFDLSIFLQ